MRLIIVLALLVSVAEGQAKLPMSELSRKSAQKVGWWGSGKMLWKEEVDSSVIQFRFVTAQDLFDYEAECYADSTLERVHRSDERMCLMDWDCIVASHWKNEWTHREPTFPGFIKYLWRQR